VPILSKQAFPLSIFYGLGVIISVVSKEEETLAACMRRCL
jgi:hypothetical protein